MAGPKSCMTPWGQVVEDGYSVEAYRDEKTKYGDDAVHENRVCHDGVLSGSFNFKESIGLPQTPEDNK